MFIFYFKKFFFNSCLFFLFFLFVRCSEKIYLKGDEKILFSQNIKGGRDLDKSKLKTFFRQVPNQRILWFPLYTHLYKFGEKRYKRDSLQKKIKKTEFIYTQKKQEVEKKSAKQIKQLLDKQREETQTIENRYSFNTQKNRNDRENKLLIQKKEKKKKKAEDFYNKKIERVKKQTEGKKNKLSDKQNEKTKNIQAVIKNGNTLMRWGEELAIYQPHFTTITIDRIQQYLYNEGYFNAKVNTEIKTVSHRVFVTYKVEEKKHYTIDSLLYDIPDTSVFSLINAHKKESFLKKNIRYSTRSIEKERKRMFDLLINNGYFYFPIEYILFKIDTHTLKNKQIIVTVEIKNKKSPTAYKKITIDSVTFIEVTNNKQWKPKQSFYKNIYFEADTKDKTLFSRILIKPNQVYRYQDNFLTQQNLSRIDIYKSVKFTFDTTHSKNSVKIYAEKIKGYSARIEGGVNLIQGLLGPFADGGFKIRNILKRLDILEVSARAIFDGLIPVIDDTANVYRNFEYGANINISFPEMLFISKILPKNVAYKNTTTQFSGGYNVLDRFITREKTYKSSSINASFLYGLENNDDITGKKQKYSVSVLQGSFLNYNVSDAFRKDIEQYPVLINSLNSSFITNSGINMQTIQSKNINGRTHHISYNIFLEIAYKLDFLGIKKIIGENKQSFSYVRLGIDYKKNIIFNKQITLAYRFNSGIILNYNGKNTSIDIPYTKYFFVGGSNGIRAWYPRRLGPGSYSQKDASITEQPGNILLEGSIEMRQKIIHILEWAPFIDFGNVWISEKDITKPNAEFNVNRFLTEIAIGGGIGLRLNLPFLLIRLDYAFKLYDPGKDPSQKWIFEFYNRYKLADISLLHFGIGYSF